MSTLREALAAHQAGDTQQAKRMVADMLQQDQTNAQAWGVLAQMAEGDQRRKALETAIRHSAPDDKVYQWAHKQLAAMNPTPQDALDDLFTDEPLPQQAASNPLPDVTPAPPQEQGLSIVNAVAIGLVLGIGVLACLFCVIPALTPSSSTLSSTEYESEMATITSVVAVTLTDLSEEFFAAGNNPSLILDEGWNNRVARHADVLRGAERESEALNPPAEYADVHALWLDAMSDCTGAMNAIEVGLGTDNADAIERGAELMTSCGEKIALTDAALND